MFFQYCSSRLGRARLVAVIPMPLRTFRLTLLVLCVIPLSANAQEKGADEGLSAFVGFDAARHPARVALEPADEGWNAAVGIGVVSTSSYEGSTNRRTLVGLDLSLSYRSPRLGTFELGPMGLIWTPDSDGELRYGLVASYDPGRLDRKPDQMDPTPGDARLAGMGEIDGSVEAGAYINWGPLLLNARKSLGNQGHSGKRLDIGLQHAVQVSERIGVRVDAGLGWADRQYMQTYFGVTASQAAASGFQRYAPDGGWYRLAVSVGADYAISPLWKVQSSLSGIHLLGDAEKSPLVEKRSYPAVAVSVVREF
jgi:outer membrane scaffolding protein for murein synthesis (MipA/OmpV family)